MGNVEISGVRSRPRRSVQSFRPSVRASFLPPLPTRRPKPRVRADDSARRNIDSNRECHSNLKNSNRESLRLEIDVTQTKQTPEPHSNRELEALFQVPINPPSSTLQIASSSARRSPDYVKNTNRSPSVLLRLTTTPILCFVGVTRSFNRTLLRVKQLVKRTKIENGGGPVSPRNAVISELARSRVVGVGETPAVQKRRDGDCICSGIFPQSSTGLHRLRARILLTVLMERFILRAD
jgi:hypothetical protein